VRLVSSPARPVRIWPRFPRVATWSGMCRTAARAAAVLVHPNTFRYRLRRLGAIAGLDLSNPEALFAAWLQLRLLVRPGGWSAFYMAAVAEELEHVDDALDSFNRRSEAQGLRSWSRAEVVPPGDFRLYRATATEQFVLDDHDARLSVHLQ
jgi:PucR C-terminal helix-turn-helix domain